MADASHRDIAIMNVQHQEPSVYYCYKFWLSTGEVQEGCTEVIVGKDLWLDPNEYGWVYMTIPIVGLFLLVLIFYALCGSKSSKANAVPAELDVMSEMATAPQYRTAAAPPYQTNPRNGLYSVIPMDTYSQQPMTKPRIYPSLSNGASRKQSTKQKIPRKSAEATELIATTPKKVASGPSPAHSTSSFEDVKK